jgi:hypothetical protein
VLNHVTKRWDRYGIVQEVNLRLRRYLVRSASGMIISRNRRYIRERVSHNSMPPIRTLDSIVPDNCAPEDDKNRDNEIPQQDLPEALRGRVLQEQPGPEHVIPKVTPKSEVKQTFQPMTPIHDRPRRKTRPLIGMG